VVARTLIRPPASRLGPADPAVRAAVFAASPLRGVYDAAIDRDSAHEVLARRGAQAAAEAAGAAEADGESDARETFSTGRRYRPAAEPAPAPRAAARRAPARRADSAGEAFVKSLARTLGSQAGRSLVRGVLGGLFRGR